VSPKSRTDFGWPAIRPFSCGPLEKIRLRHRAVFFSGYRPDRSVKAQIYSGANFVPVSIVILKSTRKSEQIISPAGQQKKLDKFVWAN
jgi:hypothetical protein